MNIGSHFYSEAELNTFKFKKIGKNVKIKNNVNIFFVENISIGDNVRIDDNVVIVASKEDVIFGSNIHIAANCYIAGSAGLQMSDFSSLAPGVMIFTGSDDYTGIKMTNPTVDKKFIGGPSGLVKIGRHVIIGAGTVILPKVKIEEGASIGAMSLVNRDLLPWMVYFGIPVKRLKSRSKKLLELEKEYLKNH